MEVRINFVLCCLAFFLNRAAGSNSISHVQCVSYKEGRTFHALPHKLAVIICLDTESYLIGPIFEPVIRPLRQTVLFSGTKITTITAFQYSCENCVPQIFIFNPCCNWFFSLHVRRGINIEGIVGGFLSHFFFRKRFFWNLWLISWCLRRDIVLRKR